ncbi:MAG TPA: hypothetical protein ENI23_10385 [bacterium]|nr:hypothetical protein [bacterium]
MKEGTDREQVLKNLVHLKRHLEMAEDGMYYHIPSPELLQCDRDRLRDRRNKDIEKINILLYNVEHEIYTTRFSENMDKERYISENARKILKNLNQASYVLEVVKKILKNEIGDIEKETEIMTTSWTSIRKEKRINMIKCRAEKEILLLIESEGNEV